VETKEWEYREYFSEKLTVTQKKETGGRSIRSAFRIMTKYQSRQEKELRVPEYRIKSGIRQRQHHKPIDRKEQ
jgi:hypothetical protein